jgi:hypothetical protein
LTRAGGLKEKKYHSVEDKEIVREEKVRERNE